MIKIARTIKITAYKLAERFIGMKEVAGAVHNPQILAMLKLDNAWPVSDEVPWCSAFVNYIAWPAMSQLKLVKKQEYGLKESVPSGGPMRNPTECRNPH